MMLSLFYVSLLLAAGSNASPCRLQSGNSSSSLTTGGDGQGSAATDQDQNQKLHILPLPYSQGSQTSSITSASSPGPSLAASGASGSSGSSGSSGNSGNSGNSGTSVTSGSLTPASGSCPPGFLNTVFNTNAGQSAGFPSTTWKSLTENGIDNWIGFSLQTLDKQADYGLSAAQAAQLGGAFNKAQIPIVMDHTYIKAAVQMLTNNPPPYLELFNEPDYSFEGLTLTEDAAPSASDLKVLFDTPHPNTKYISPALMNANGPWLSQFFQACNGCIDQIDVIALHVYNPDPQYVLDQITQLYSTWKKPIWITELSPATSGCGLNSNSIGTDYISKLIPAILKLGYVEKIFWNSGENDNPPINGAPASCSSSLTNSDGSATPILRALGAACGIKAGTATS